MGSTSLLTRHQSPEAFITDLENGKYTEGAKGGYRGSDFAAQLLPVGVSRCSIAPPHRVLQERGDRALADGDAVDFGSIGLIGKNILWTHGDAVRL